MQTINIDRRLRVLNIVAGLISPFFTKPLGGLVRLFAVLVICQGLGVFRLQLHAVFLLPRNSQVQHDKEVGVLNENSQLQLDAAESLFEQYREKKK